MRQENFAKYILANPKNKKQAAQLTSSNSLCGDRFKLKINSKSKVVKIINKFDYTVAELSEEDSKLIKLWTNKNLEVITLLSCVFYCEPQSKHSAEFLILAYPKKHAQEYENFASCVSDKLANGSRPDICLDEFECKEIVKSNGAFKITKFLKAPELEKGTVVLKNKQSFMEKIIEAARQRKIGCYFGSILFIIIILGLII